MVFEEPFVTFVSEAGAKRSTITIGTEQHVCIEIVNHAILFSWSTWLATHMDHGRVRLMTTTLSSPSAVAMQPTPRGSCSLGLQHISLILDIHIMVTSDQYHVAISLKKLTADYSIRLDRALM